MVVKENERGEVENENQKNLQIIENLTNNLYEVESRLAAESKVLATFSDSNLNIFFTAIRITRNRETVA